MDIHPAVRFNESFKKPVTNQVNSLHIETLFVAFNKQIAKQTLDLYAQRCSNYPESAVKQAVEYLITTEKFMPSISDVIVKIRSFLPKQKDHAHNDFIKKYDDEQKRFKRLSNEAVERLGSPEEVAAYANQWISAKFPWMSNHDFKKLYLKSALFDLEDSGWNIAKAIKG